MLAGQEDLLRELTTTRPGITLAEIRDALIERGLEPGSLTTIWSTLRRLGLSHKKRMARPVCKWLVRSELNSLRQRIRPVGSAVAKMEIRALRS